MSTDNLTLLASTLPNRQISNVSSANASEINRSSSIVAVIDRTDLIASERQDVATKGQNVPVNLVADDNESENQEDRLEAAVSDINSYVQSVRRELQFTVSDLLPFGRAFVKVVDSDTGEVIREIPSEEALKIARKINEQVEANNQTQGLIFSDQA